MNMEPHWLYIPVILFGGMAVGGVIVWQYAKSRIAPLKAELNFEKKRTEERLAILREAEENFRDAFKALSYDALKSSNEEFLKLAREQLESVQEKARGDLDQRRQAVEHLVAPIRESMEKVESNIRNLESAREGAYRELLAHIEQLAVSNRNLRAQTMELATALKNPSVGGFWGELQLKRIVELSGMKGNYDFTEQKGYTDDERRYIPDMVVHLPGNKCIVVDAKVSTKAYLEATRSGIDPRDQQESYAAFAGHIKNHIDTLKSKKYWEHIPNTTEFVVMFLPGENFLKAALDQNPALIEYGADNNIILATPTTLISLLKAVAYGWRQEEMQKNALKIKEAAEKLYSRLGTFLDHFDGIRKGLDRASDAYNRAVGSLEARVLPAARDMNELGLGAEEGLNEPVRSDKRARALQAPELEKDGS